MYADVYSKAAVRRFAMQSSLLPHLLLQKTNCSKPAASPTHGKSLDATRVSAWRGHLRKQRSRIRKGWGKKAHCSTRRLTTNRSAPDSKKIVGRAASSLHALEEYQNAMKIKTIGLSIIIVLNACCDSMRLGLAFFCLREGISNFRDVLTSPSAFSRNSDYRFQSDTTAIQSVFFQFQDMSRFTYQLARHNEPDALFPLLYQHSTSEALRITLYQSLLLKTNSSNLVRGRHAGVTVVQRASTPLTAGCNVHRTRASKLDRHAWTVNAALALEFKNAPAANSKILDISQKSLDRLNPIAIFRRDYWLLSPLLTSSTLLTSRENQQPGYFKFTRPARLAAAVRLGHPRPIIPGVLADETTGAIHNHDAFSGLLASSHFALPSHSFASGLSDFSAAQLAKELFFNAIRPLLLLPLSRIKYINLKHIQ